MMLLFMDKVMEMSMLKISNVLEKNQVLLIVQEILTAVVIKEILV